MSRFLNRFYRAAKLDVSLYQEIVEDGGTMNQALIVVFIYCMASAYGTFGRTGATGINIGMITTLLGWYVWAFSTYIVGARFLPETQTKPDRKALMRALGFASAPGILCACWGLCRVLASLFYCSLQPGWSRPQLLESNRR